MRTVQHLYQCSYRVQSGRFEDRGEALSATDAHRLEAQPAATAPQFVQHAGQDRGRSPPDAAVLTRMREILACVTCCPVRGGRRDCPADVAVSGNGLIGLTSATGLLWRGPRTELTEFSASRFVARVE